MIIDRTKKKARYSLFGKSWKCIVLRKKYECLAFQWKVSTINGGIARDRTLIGLLRGREEKRNGRNAWYYRRSCKGGIDQPFVLVVLPSHRISVDVISRGKYLDGRSESFEKIISINCHLTATSLKRVDRVQRYIRFYYSHPYIDLYFLYISSMLFHPPDTRIQRTRGT